MIKTLFNLILLTFALTALNAQEAELVYIQKSQQGVLKQLDDDYYTLELKGNDLNLVYFADQPNRSIGKENLTHFFQNWKKDLASKKHAPTAFINYTDFETQDQGAVSPDILELQEPIYNEETDTLIFKVKPLHEHPIQKGAFKNLVIIYDRD